MRTAASNVVTNHNPFNTVPTNGIAVLYSRSGGFSSDFSGIIWGVEFVGIGLGMQDVGGCGKEEKG
jgi:hypothetical protein